MNSIQSLLQFLNDNWTSIIVCIGLILAIYRKSKNYFSKSKEEKIAIAKTQIQEIILKLISDAESDYEEWNEAGSIKRAQVIEEILLEYPVLSKVTNQDELITWIDDVIDEALVTLRNIISKQIE